MKKVVALFLYTPALVNKLEIWLSNKAENGFLLISAKKCIYIFEMASPQTVDYFMYSPFGAHQGISFDYHRAKVKYENKKTKLSSSVIFEVDVSKIDQDYLKYKALRNKYYIRHYSMLAAMVSVFAILGMFAYEYKYMSFVVSVCILVFLYSLISLLILLMDR